MSGQARSSVQVDNDHVRVTEWTFAPGEATGWHRHDYDYVITPVTSSQVGLVDGQGRESRVEMVAGASYYRAAGVEHDVINRGDGELRFVEVELKSRPG